MPTPCRPRSTPTKARELHVRYRRAETVAARGARQQQEHQHHQAHHWHEHQQVPPPGAIGVMQPAHGHCHQRHDHRQPQHHAQPADHQRKRA
ncbi:hypothetical protein G6F64_014953 [Rhizopus arrhizus]|uniref:Uncharacterized protein n=1 Tax=Rhizopus oryzae TaxID=64495 RepID=A0A9P6WT79_RHIOR|nr:hypothetical protein G6F64_014953 [Rhizopus arrhizus]KAG1375336.1 hypothetical protein G6F59_018336 [Rhizopus arrhizus]